MLYKTEASPNGGGAMKSFTAKQENGFVRYTATGSSDPYIHIYRSGNVVTGQYAVIKYRVVNQNADCTVGSFFAGTVVTNYNGAQGKYGDNSIIKLSDKFFGDGEWHYLVITPNLATNTAFAANEDGTYSWQYLRIGVGGMKAYDNSCYIDIDEIAFADNAEAAEYYAYKNDPKPATLRGAYHSACSFVLGLFSNNNLFATHIRTEGNGDADATVCLEVVFQEGNQHTRRCHHRVVEGVGKVLAALTIYTNAEAACLCIA